MSSGVSRNERTWRMPSFCSTRLRRNVLFVGRGDDPHKFGGAESVVDHRTRAFGRVASSPGRFVQTIAEIGRARVIV